MHCPRLWGKSEVLDFMKLTCEERKHGLKMTSILKSEACDRLCRLHWPQLSSAPCIMLIAT